MPKGKAPGATLLTMPFTVMFRRDVQPAKAFASMLLTMPLIVSEASDAQF